MNGNPTIKFVIKIRNMCLDNLSQRENRRGNKGAVNLDKDSSDMYTENSYKLRLLTNNNAKLLLSEKNLVFINLSRK